MKTFRHAALVLLSALAGCGGEKVNVHVQCKTTASSAECTLQQTQGKSEVEVCWDFTVTCDNGAVVKAPHNCAKIKDGGTLQVTIPADKLIGLEKCGGSKPPVGKLENKTLNGKPSD